MSPAPQQPQVQQQAPPSQPGQANIPWGNLAKDFTKGSNPMLGMAAQYGVDNGKKIAQETVAKYMPGMSLLWDSLRYHFNVNNKYVVNKMRILLFPFRRSNWNREISQGSVGNAPKHAPPLTDINAPDMYIPLMSFVTYVLIVGLLKGTRMKFTPEVLLDVFTASIVIEILQVVIIKAALYVIQQGAVTAPVVELFIYCGYKYFGLAINMLSGLFFGPKIYYFVLAYTAATTSFFIFKTMGRVVPKPGMDQSGTKRRLYFLILCAGLQVLSMWWLGYSRDMYVPERLGSEKIATAEVNAPVEANKAD